jgi:probable addiction module antidote protein
MIARVKGISVIAEEVGMTRNGIQKALSERGNPKLENINAIMNSMGYRLTPEKIEINS